MTTDGSPTNGSPTNGSPTNGSPTNGSPTNGDGDGDLPAGAFSTWLADMQAALRAERDADVPCGGCTACCRSSQFVHIGPDEADALAHIPAELLFPAPRMPSGHVLMGYDERGRCPMLTNDGCSVYEHRPRTCRTYDCRVFAAAGVEPNDDDLRRGGLPRDDLPGDDRADIAARARRWRFDFPAEADRTEHGAVRAAAEFISQHGELLGEGVGPIGASPLAVLAVELHGLFLGGAPPDGPKVVEPDVDAVRVALRSRARR